jgi:hypothetical protein
MRQHRDGWESPRANLSKKLTATPPHSHLLPVASECSPGASWPLEVACRVVAPLDAGGMTTGPGTGSGVGPDGARAWPGLGGARGGVDCERAALVLVTEREPPRRRAATSAPAPTA